MTLTNDDTQPRSPFSPAEPAATPRRVPRVPTTHAPGDAPPPDDAPAGAGCWTTGLLLAAVVGFALVIVALSGVAGWTVGVREAQAAAAATQAQEIGVQLTRIPTDVAQGNTFLLGRRLDYLATQGVSIAPFVPTATALYLTAQPTATVAATATPSAAPTLNVTPTPTLTGAQSGGGYDLNALLNDAQIAINLRDWMRAIETLDVIIALDPNFQTQTVRALMAQALNAQALDDYRAFNLAQAILLTDRAEEFGPLNPPDLAFERDVAIAYLNAVRLVDTDYPRAIAALKEVYALSPNYNSGLLRQLLFDQLVAYGDALVAGGQSCSAVFQYDDALTYLVSASVSGKRDAANLICLTAATPPTLDPFYTPAPGITPVGQP